MGLESGTWIEDLVPTNPPSTDDKRQGDDHIRLIKAVLKNSLKRTSGRPVYFPTSASLTANYAILDTDENTVFRCSTASGAFSLTLPNTLTTANAGWRVFVVKTNSEANPVFIVPPTGLLDGFAQVRRTAENKMTEVMWTGTGWAITRPNNAPVGTVHEYYGATLPNGHLWPDGGTFVAADFAELNSVLGGNTKPDLRGRAAFGRDDMGGSAAGRVTGASGITGTTLKATGGEEAHVLVAGEIGLHTHSFTTDPESNHTHSVDIDSQGESAGHTHNFTAVRTTTTTFAAGGNPTGAAAAASTPNTGINSNDHFHNVSGNTDPGSAHSHTGDTDNNTGGGAHQNMPPTIVCNKIMVAE